VVKAFSAEEMFYMRTRTGGAPPLGNFSRNRFKGLLEEKVDKGFGQNKELFQLRLRPRKTPHTLLT